MNANRKLPDSDHCNTIGKPCHDSRNVDVETIAQLRREIRGLRRQLANDIEPRQVDREGARMVAIKHLFKIVNFMASNTLMPDEREDYIDETVDEILDALGFERKDG